jgi:elongation factor Tu
MANESTVDYTSASRTYTHIDCPGDVDAARSLIGTTVLDGVILVVSSNTWNIDYDALNLVKELGIPRIVVFASNVDEDDAPYLDSLQGYIRDELTYVDFPGSEIPFVTGSALKALEGDPAQKQRVLDLVAALDTYVQTAQPDTGTIATLGAIGNGKTTLTTAITMALSSSAKQGMRLEELGMVAQQFEMSS